MKFVHKNNEPFRVSWRAMGTEVLLIADCPLHERNAIEQAVRIEFAQCEQIMSRFRENSELTLLNRSLGKRRAVSDRLWDVLQIAFEAYTQTEGTFDPRIVLRLQVLGYPGADIPLASCTADQAKEHPWIEFSNNRSVTLYAPVDLGGIGKGYTLDRVAALLNKSANRFLVSAGGDIVYGGTDLQRPHWDVGVEWPFDTTRLAAVWRVPAGKSGALCTSADSKRYWYDRDGGRQHHLIDPVTGMAGGTGYRSVTIHGEKASASEVLTKVLFLRGLRALEQCPAQLAALFIDVDRRLWATPTALPELFWTASACHEIRDVDRSCPDYC